VLPLLEMRLKLPLPQLENDIMSTNLHLPCATSASGIIFKLPGEPWQVMPVQDRYDAISNAMHRIIDDAPSRGFTFGSAHGLSATFGLYVHDSGHDLDLPYNLSIQYGPRPDQRWPLLGPIVIIRDGAEGYPEVALPGDLERLLALPLWIND
jgi:hypothetical protein